MKTSAYFAPLVLLPTVIAAPGQYRTRCGETVTVETVPPGIRHHAHDCHGSYANGTREAWHRSGRLYAGPECVNDIVSRVQDG